MSFVLAACHGISVIDEKEVEEGKRRKRSVSDGSTVKDFYHTASSGKLPLAPAAGEGHGPKFIGDSLEVEVFKKSGW